MTGDNCVFRSWVRLVIWSLLNWLFENSTMQHLPKFPLKLVTSHRSVGVFERPCPMPGLGRYSVISYG
jgi:hypothetical protein